MKKIICFLLVYCSINCANAQVALNFELNWDTLIVDKYKWQPKKANHAYLQMPFGDFTFSNTEAIKRLRNKKITHISLVYTDFPTGKDLTELHKKRLASLYIYLPEVFENDAIEWSLVKQTGCTASNAHRYFHGFVVQYQAETVYESSLPKTYESRYLQDVLAGNILLKDSTFLNVMERNKDWKNIVIVCDFTGSMSPYVAQVLLWHQLHIANPKAKSFVFFNDGDNKLDNNKIAGKTGGIYWTEQLSMDSVLKLAVETAQKGGGGDSPENNVEALLLAMEKYPDADHFVLVSDNSADMRDYSLISKLKKPVRVILCGTKISYLDFGYGMMATGRDGINTQYLDLAKETNGSVHTIESDLDELTKLNEGAEFSIGSYKFKIEKGKFVPVQKGKNL